MSTFQSCIFTITCILKKCEAYRASSGRQLRTECGCAICVAARGVSQHSAHCLLNWGSYIYPCMFLRAGGGGSQHPETTLQAPRFQLCPTHRWELLSLRYILIVCFCSLLRRAARGNLFLHGRDESNWGQGQLCHPMLFSSFHVRRVLPCPAGFWSLKVRIVGLILSPRFTLMAGTLGP